MHESRTVIRLQDTDAAGVVFFANYYAIAHTAYEAFMDTIGFGLDWIIQTADYIILIVHSEADYRRPLFLGDQVSIEIEAEFLGRSSFGLVCTFRNGQGEVAATVKTVHVVVNKQSGETEALPEKLRSALASISQNDSQGGAQPDPAVPGGPA